MEIPKATENGNAFQTTAFLIVAIFFVYALADISGGLAFPMSSLGGDSIMTFTRAVAAANPQAFAADSFFSDPSNYAFYLNFNTLFVEFFYRTQILDPNIAYRVLHGFAVFLFLAGYFLLGRCILGSNIAGLFYAVACAVALPTISGDYWGFFREPQARFLFSAGLPYVCLLAFKKDPKVSVWLGVFFGMGFLSWVHPASGPPVALAMMCAMTLGNLTIYNIGPVIAKALVSGLLYILIFLPYAYIYISGTQSSISDPQILETIKTALNLRFDQAYLDILAAFKGGFGRLFAGWRVLLPILAIAAAIYLLGAVRREEHVRVKTLVLATLFIPACSFGIPMFDSWISAQQGRVQSELDIIRAMRYLVPFMLLVVAWAAFRFWQPNAKAAIGAVCILMSGWYIAAGQSPKYPQNKLPGIGFDCAVKGQVPCNLRNTPVQDMLDYISSNIRPEATFFAPGLAPKIRVITRRKLAYSWRDTGWLAYSDKQKFASGYTLMKKYKAIRDNVSKYPKEASRWLEFARLVDADYTVLRVNPKKLGLNDNDTVVYSKKNLTIVKMAGTSN